MKLRPSKIRQIVLAHAKVLKTDPMTFYVPLSGFAEQASRDLSVRQLLEQLQTSSNRHVDCGTWGLSSNSWRDAIEQAMAANMLKSFHGEVPSEAQIEKLLG